jgi:hypothetical protein
MHRTGCPPYSCTKTLATNLKQKASTGPLSIYLSNSVFHKLCPLKIKLLLEVASNAICGNFCTPHCLKPQRIISKNSSTCSVGFKVTSETQTYHAMTSRVHLLGRKIQTEQQGSIFRLLLHLYTEYLRAVNQRSEMGNPRGKTALTTSWSNFSIRTFPSCTETSLVHNTNSIILPSFVFSSQISRIF